MHVFDDGRKIQLRRSRFDFDYESVFVQRRRLLYHGMLTVLALPLLKNGGVEGNLSRSIRGTRTGSDTLRTNQ